MNFTADTTSGEEGAALFRAHPRAHPDLPVILLTAWTHLDAAVDLVKAGAADYLAKPWNDHRLIATVTNLLELGQANRALHQRAAGASGASGATLRTRLRPARPGVAGPGHGARGAAWPARWRAPTCRC